jgi:hypothetical protein
MGEAKRRAKHGAQPPRPHPKRDPDFGEFMRRAGWAGSPLVLVSAKLMAYSDNGDGTCDVTFVIHTPARKYMGTLNTPQPAALLAMTLDGRSPMRIDAELDTELVQGQGGERYRMLIGTVHRLDPADAAAIEPTIGCLHPDRVKNVEMMAGECRNRITNEPVSVIAGFNPPIDPLVIEFLAIVPEPVDPARLEIAERIALKDFADDPWFRPGFNPPVDPRIIDILDKFWVKTYDKVEGRQLMPKPTSRKKPKAGTGKVVHPAAPAMFEDPLDPFGLPPASDPRVVADQVDPLVAAVASQLGQGWPKGVRHMLGDIDITADLRVLYDQLAPLAHPDPNSRKSLTSTATPSGSSGTG